MLNKEFIMNILRTQHLIMIVSEAAEPNKKTIRLAIGLGWVGPEQHGNRKRDKKPEETRGTPHPQKDERAA